MKKLEKNELFFEEWSHDMAYVLGFLTADGHVDIKRGNIEFKLHRKDREILEFIRDCISPNSNITDILNKSNYGLSKQNRLRIGSIKIVSDLVNRYGFQSYKTGREIMPDMPDLYIGDFIRGVFDGDGCVGSYKTEPLSCSISSGSESFLYQMRIAVGNLGYICPTNQKKVHFQWKMTTVPALRFREIIYNGNRFSLERKRIKFYNFRPSMVRHFTELEDSIISDYRETHGYLNFRHIGALLDRPGSSILWRARKLGIYNKGDRNGNQFSGARPKLEVF